MTGTRQAAGQVRWTWAGMGMAKRQSSGQSAAKGKTRPFGLFRSLLSLFFSLLLGALLLGALGLGLYTLYLDAVIRAEFDEKRWAMPAKVSACASCSSSIFSSRLSSSALSSA